MRVALWHSVGLLLCIGLFFVCVCVVSESTCLRNKVSEGRVQAVCLISSLGCAVFWGCTPHFPVSLIDFTGLFTGLSNNGLNVAMESITSGVTLAEASWFVTLDWVFAETNATIVSWAHLTPQSWADLLRFWLVRVSSDPVLVMQIGLYVVLFLLLLKLLRPFILICLHAVASFMACSLDIFHIFCDIIER